MQSAVSRAITPNLTVIDGTPTTSNEVAQTFSKDHAKVLRDIRTLPAYRLTRDGFTLLAIGNIQQIGGAA